MTARPGKLVAALATLAVAAVAFSGPAWAHATFPGQSSYPTNTDQRLTVDVPLERGDGPYNVRIDVYLPADWLLKSCEVNPTWTCNSDITNERPVVHWVKNAGAAPTGKDEDFVLAAHTGAPGRATIPVLQTYSTGEVVRWIGPPDDEEPAPYLDIVSASATTTTIASATTTRPPSSTTASITSTTLTSPKGATTNSISTKPNGLASSTTASSSAVPTPTPLTTPGVPTSEWSTVTTVASPAGGSATTAASDPSTTDPTDVAALAVGPGGPRTGSLIWVAVAAMIASVGSAVYLLRRPLTPINQ